MNTCIQIFGYDVGDVLWRNSRRVVYRVTRLSDGIACILETVDAQYPDRDLVIGLRRESVITQQLNDIDGIKKIHHVLPHV